MRIGEDAAKESALLAFGQYLKRLRLASDLTQEELAERAGVSARLISDLERGTIHRPRRDTVQMLADGLHLRGTDRDSFIALARGRAVLNAPSALADAGPRRMVPYPPTPIVGRLKETAAATALLLDSDVRLLTLTGPGGVGKTRLALEVAHRVGDAFADGAVFVDLAPVRDAELVLSAISQAQGVVPSPDASLRQATVAALREAQLLLILDNFEHVPAAAVVVADLLAACSGVSLLVTSRTPLRIRAEREYAVGPLALPDQDGPTDLDELRRVPAVELFVRRAEVADREFALTVENARAVSGLVVRLDGLPLAIELAATRMKILTPDALLVRMEQRLPFLTRGAHDLPMRQQAMRATLDWSHDLLSAEEQGLFRRLAVFAGGCTLDAAERVGLDSARVFPSASSSSAFVIDLLSDLVDKSLLRTVDDTGAERRFGMLETIREYGLERLEEASEEDDVRRRHLAWCVDLAERTELELIGPNQQRWFATLDAEHDNLRAALGWTIAKGDATAAMRLSGALHRFWATRGHYEEGRRWLEAALALDTGERSAPRGYALNGLGVLAWYMGDIDRAETVWREMLPIFGALDDRRYVAYAHGNLGLIGDAREDYEQATESYERALALFRELGDQTHTSFMLGNLGLIAYFQENYPKATALIEESLGMARMLGDQQSIALNLGNLGLVAFAQGDYECALARNAEALALGQHLSNRPWLARSLSNFAMIAAATGKSARAARLFAAAAALRKQLGATLPPNDQTLQERYLAAAREHLGDGFACAWAEGEALSLDEAIDFALDPVGPGH
jgi:predicted ATPase/DNA-binding XRE family transcriptional regulator